MCFFFKRIIGFRMLLRLCTGFRLDSSRFQGGFKQTPAHIGWPNLDHRNDIAGTYESAGVRESYYSNGPTTGQS